MWVFGRPDPGIDPGRVGKFYWIGDSLTLVGNLPADVFKVGDTLRPQSLLADIVSLLSEQFLTRVGRIGMIARTYHKIRTILDYGEYTFPFADPLMNGRPIVGTVSDVNMCIVRPRRLPFGWLEFNGEGDQGWPEHPVSRGQVVYWNTHEISVVLRESPMTLFDPVSHRLELYYHPVIARMGGPIC